MARYAAMISHSSKDAQAAQTVGSLLESRGLRCWIAPRDLAPGEQWAEGIVRGIESATAVVLLVSEHINQSAHVLGEITQAVNLGRPIFPLVLDDVRLTRSLDYYLRPLHWLFVRSGAFDEHVDKLHQAIDGSRDWGDLATAPSFPRRLRHGSRQPIVAAFVGSLAALALAGGGAWLAWRAQSESEAAARNASYLSVGWVALSSASRPIAAQAVDRAQPWAVSGNLFFAAGQPQASELRLVFAPDPPTGADEPYDVSAQIDPAAAGHARPFQVRVDRLPRRIVVCLTTPHPALSIPVRVRQRFEVSPAPLPGDGAIERWEFTAISEPTVTPESAQPCAGEAQ